MLIRKSLWWKGRLNKIMALAIGDIKSPRCLGHYCCICFPLNILSLRARLFFFLMQRKNKKRKNQGGWEYMQFSQAPIYTISFFNLYLEIAARFLCPLDFPGKNTGGVAISFSRRSSTSRDRTCVPRIESRFFTNWATREARLEMSVM